MYEDNVKSVYLSHQSSSWLRTARHLLAVLARRMAHHSFRDFRQ
jgi:hypothetical protein